MPEGNVTVLTSENSAEFYAKRMGLPEETQDEVKPVEEKVIEPEVIEETPEEEIKEVKKPNKLEKRFSELTRAREQAEERARVAEQKAQELEDRINPPKKVQDQEPTPDQFNDPFEYAKALSEWTKDKALRERDERDIQKRVEEEHATTIKAWSTRQDAFKSETPDYDEVVASSDVMVSNEIRDALLESEAGPQLLYYLAHNEEEAERIASLSVRRGLIELGKLEVKLLSGKEPPKKEADAEISKAPSPITPIKGSKISDTPIDSKGEFHGTYQQWKAARQAGKIT